MGSTTSTRAVVGALIGAALLSACASSGGHRSEFIAPLDRMVVSAEFGERRGVRRSRHLGTDLRAPHGTVVAAARSGRVIFRGRKRGYGNLIILDHGRDMTTYYAHLSDFAVGHGEGVGTGQTIGFVGQSGNATGPHLHFELREGGKPVDPRQRVAF